MSDFNWSFEEKNGIEPVPEGAYRVRIYKAEKAISKAGNDMLHLQLEVSGKPNIVHHYIVFMPDKPDITNRNLTQFFASFGIDPKSPSAFNVMSYIDLVGAAYLIVDGEYNRVKYFINKNRQAELPPWLEKDGKPPVSPTLAGFTAAENEDLPF